MTFKDLSYKEKNKLLGVAAILVLVICWFLSFSKTFQQRTVYTTLISAYQLSSYENPNRGYDLQHRDRQLDSLVKKYSTDSIAFESNFLQNVSLALAGMPVKLSYDGSKQSLESSYGILGKEILLEGSFQDIVEATAALEKDFFVKRVSYKGNLYNIIVSRLIEY